jgi:hypothetical protein
LFHRARYETVSLMKPRSGLISRVFANGDRVLITMIAFLYNIRSLHNVGSIFRTADAALALIPTPFLVPCAIINQI